ncbi:MAG: hypothetical protein H7X95_14745 [Deltaproteobacteria bacterium]|nr:hypothetical protein [Deltaproteobacteria bacterium]
MPAAQAKSQSCVPAPPAGQRTTHVEPAAQLEWQGDAEQVKVHVLFVPQSHLPFAQVPVHVVLAEQLTWQGCCLHVKLHLLPWPHEHVPFAQTASHASLSPLHRA